MKYKIFGNQMPAVTLRLEAGESRQVMNMIRLLQAVDPLSSEAVPGDSILRETIGGSQLEY